MIFHFNIPDANDMWVVFRAKEMLFVCLVFCKISISMILRLGHIVLYSWNRWHGQSTKHTSRGKQSVPLLVSLEKNLIEFRQYEAQSDEFQFLRLRIWRNWILAKAYCLQLIISYQLSNTFIASMTKMSSWIFFLCRIYIFLTVVAKNRKKK